MNEDKKVGNSQIKQKSAYIGETITALEESVGELEKRLETVMVVSQMVNESKVAKESPAISPLGCQLDAYNFRLQSICSSVTDILDRLDL